MRVFNLNEEFLISRWTRGGDEAGAVGGLDEGIPGIRCFWKGSEISHVRCLLTRISCQPEVHSEDTVIRAKVPESGQFLAFLSTPILKINTFG